MWLVVCAALTAADFWDENDFSVWSDEEVQKMLTNSPWSRTVTIALGGPAGRGGGRSGGGFAGGGAARLGGRGGGGRGGGDDFGPAPRRMTLTISWRSALPVKQAVVRGKIGADTRRLPERRQFLAQQEPLYIVSVAGFPRQFTRLAQDRDALIRETSLELEDREPIPAEDAEVLVENDETVIIEYAFSRDAAITVADKEVEFIAKVGEIEIKRTFKLEDMVFGEQLAL